MEHFWELLTCPAESRAGCSGFWAPSGGFPCPLALVPQPRHHGLALFFISTGPSGPEIFGSGFRILGGPGAARGPAALPGARTPPLSREQGSLRLLLLLRGAVPRPMGAFHTPSHLTEVAASPGGFVGSSCPVPPAPHGRTVPILLGTGGAHGGGGSAPCPHKPVPASLGLLCLRGLLGVFWGAPKGVAPTPHGGVVFSYGERASELKARVSQQPREPISSKGSHLHPDFLSSVKKGDY